MALDNPDLIVACVVGDGEAETGPLATAWHSNKFLNPMRDGAVLPILNLNGYKIANPTILARISHEELEALFVGYGYTPYFVEGSDPAAMHQKMAATLERAVGEIRAVQQAARAVEHAGPSALADDRAALAEGMDRAEGDQGSQGRGVVALAPGAVRRRARQSRAPEAARRLDAQLPARGAVRRERPAGARAEGAGAEGHAADERQPARQRRAAAQGPQASRLPRTTPSPCSARGTAQHENTKPLGEFLRDVMKQQPDHLPRLRPGRDRLEPAAGALRGEQEDLDGRHAAGGRRRRRAVAATAA